MRGLFVSGWSQDIGDGSGVWQIADKVEKLGDVTLRRTCFSLSPMDILTADYAVVYSYGMAAFWNAKKKLQLNWNLKHLFVITGVPRIFWGQLYGGIWTMPVQISRATAYNTNCFTWPLCAGIKNPDNVRFTNVKIESGVLHSQADQLPWIHESILSKLSILRLSRDL